MGRIDLPDRPVDWVSVTKDFLHELYDDIARLKEEKAALEAENAVLEQQVRLASLAA